jgi:hypothetical protein
MPSGQVRPERALLSSFREKHPRIYSFLYQTLLLIITFECALAIARYGPERDGVNPAPASSPVPRTLLPRLPLPKKNSSTPHKCVHGAREDYVDLGPQLIVRFHLSFSLSPSTSFHPLIHPLPPNLYIHTHQPKITKTGNNTLRHPLPQHPLLHPLPPHLHHRDPQIPRLASQPQAPPFHHLYKRHHIYIH